MDLRLQLVSRWPKLAWSACLHPGEASVLVLHGPCVELGDHWCVEAVWAGDFTKGDFHRTELIFGTGVRNCNEHTIFVSAGTMMDRLWHCQLEGEIYVSNSLPCLLASANVNLRDEYRQYQIDIETQQLGLNQYVKSLPADPCDVHLTYYRNLRWDGLELVEVDKPDTCPDFHTYGDYYQYLVNAAGRLGANLNDEKRRHRVVPLAGVSTGYDSGAAAAIARVATCHDTVTIKNASSLFPRSDSGEEVSEYLKMRCDGYHHTPKAYRYEETIWSATGRPAGLNLTIFNYPKPLCAFFSGYRGDSMWRRERLDRSQPFRANCSDGLGLAEFRLHQGIFHCLVPFLGSHKAEQVQEITFSDEMTPWTLGGKYDRPIPRRILEEAGVPRSCFGIKKEATYAPGSLHWPFTPKASEDFRRYLRKRDVRAPGRMGVWLRRRLRALDQLIVVNLNHALGTRMKGLRKYLGDSGEPLIVQWANHRLKEHYQHGLKQVDKQGLS